MKIKERLKKYRRIFFYIADIILICIAYYMIQFFVGRNIFLLPETVLDKTINSIVLSIIIYQVFLNLYGLYKNITRFESGKEYLLYGLVCTISCITVSLIGYVFKLDVLGVRLNILAGFFIAVGMITYRVMARIILTKEISYLMKKQDNNRRKKLLIIGAGEAAREIIRSIHKNLESEYQIVGLIDDNKNKFDYTVSGVKILGGRTVIQQVCKDYNVEEIFLAISKISAEEKRRILHICQDTNCRVRILPGIEDIIRNKGLMESLRDVEIEDLLGRQTVELDTAEIEPLIKDKVVLVTGGGGSIGSELCRQIMTHDPKTLIMLDIYENTLYDIEIELKKKYPNADIQAVIASVRDKDRLNDVFKKYKPYLVFHAAAHKHVPLMEASPLEAIHNNVFGTYNVVNCCDEFNVKRCILISTDKAVNPTNIMGATKRICEMIIQAKAKASNTEYAAVRFGNVLGSNGSVIPLFKKQIKEGGPVTVTHQEITRFFMTIPEAVSLVLQAMTFAKEGEIFVLDMGEPVKIYDLAVNLIKLSGLEPNVDIEIKFTGLRPGEKLYEEILMSEEGLEKTENMKIFIANPLNISMKQLEEKLQALQKLEYKNNCTIEEIKNTMKAVVPTYRESKESVNEEKNKKNSNIIYNTAYYVDDNGVSAFSSTE